MLETQPTIRIHQVSISPAHRFRGLALTSQIHVVKEYNNHPGTEIKAEQQPGSPYGVAVANEHTHGEELGSP